MNDPTLKLLGSTEFNPEKYVKELSQNCVGRLELARLRGVIQTQSSETSANLKRNVFQNYKQFINTAKEISHLESEMYQLSHLLTEQKTLLNALYNTSILGDDMPLMTETDTKKNKEEKDDELRRQRLTTILEKVEGCIDLLEVPNRMLLHEGHVTELESIDNTPLASVWAFLFTDGLMLATISGNIKRRYKYLAFYDLGSLAVVNVRDLGSVKYAFKLLAFPDTRLFQCTSNQSKREWIDKFDMAKKARLTQDQKRESMSEKSPSRSTSTETTNINPFDDGEEDTIVHPDWMLEVAEELDVYIAQRQFENALNLLQKAKDYVAQFTTQSNQPDHVFIDIQRKVEQRSSTLTEVLMKELEVSPDKSLQGGLRAARRAVRILNLLGRSTQSCHLFLRLCSSMLKTQCKRVKREGSTIMYVRHLSSVVFTNMCHMTEEFLRAFPDSPTCTSAYVVWATGELRLFTSHFIKQVFMPQTSLSTITECVILVRQQCEKLCSYGIDICYQLDGALRMPLIKAINDTRDKFIDVVRRKSNENKWIPVNLRSKVGLSRFLQEYIDLGLNLDSYITGDYWLQLSTNTLFFTKLFLTLLDDCIRLRYQELSHTIDDVLIKVFANHMQYYEQSLANEQLETKQFIMKNVSFLTNTVLDLAQEKYETSIGIGNENLKKLQMNYVTAIKDDAKTRIIPKYSSNEYL